MLANPGAADQPDRTAHLRPSGASGRRCRVSVAWMVRAASLLATIVAAMMRREGARCPHTQTARPDIRSNMRRTLIKGAAIVSMDPAIGDLRRATS